jgi:hypothetical protein
VTEWLKVLLSKSSVPVTVPRVRIPPSPPRACYHESMFIALVIGLLVLVILAFEIWMFVDAIRNPRLKSTEKFLWCLGMLFFHPIVAIVYYFVVYAKNR